MAGAFITDDLATFFDEAEFADAATFDGSAGYVVGIFDKDFDLALIGVGDIASTAPVFTLRSADVPANVQGRYLRFGNILAGGSRYRVANVHPGGTGVTLLQLQEA